MRCACALSVWAILTTPMIALAAVRLSGTIVDASGAPVPGASVTVSVQGKTFPTTITDDAGLFDVPDVPDGEATVRASAPGFAEAVLHTATGTGAVRVVLQPAPFVDTMTVTASRGDERLATAAATTVVTSAELLNSPAGTLDDALRNTPGFSLFRRSSSRVANPTTQGVTLRGVSGSGASRTVVLADGLPLNDAFGSWVYWNRIPQAAIERVEVVRGASGDLYGADALGGVVQVLTFAPGRTRVRAILDGGSHDSWRFSGFGGTQRGRWHGAASGEWVRTDGVVIVAPEVRGSADVEADSDYGTGFVAGGFNADTWHANVRISLYDEARGNGTRLQVNTTEWRQVSGEAGGSAAGGAWLVHAGGGTQTYFQTFTAVAADRRSERLTTEQTTPSTFSSVSGQWSRGWGSRVLLVGADGKYTRSSVEEIRYAVSGAASGPFVSGGKETTGSGFARIAWTPRDDLTVVAGARAEVWQSDPRGAFLPEHSAAFFSPRASAAFQISEILGVQAAAYRAYRTPSLNELHRSSRVGNVLINANPLLDPERLTGIEGGVLVKRGTISARATGFWNELDEAITNVTLSSTPALITREKQNTDSVRAGGLELEADVRPHPRWTFGALVALTRSRFSDTPAQPALEGNRVPQVPTYQFGGTITYVDPRAFTAWLQLRVVGGQYDDDLNQFKLEKFAVVDASASQALRRGVQLFLAVENLFDTEYDVGRTPLRTIGWPRTLRVGLRLFLPQ